MGEMLIEIRRKKKGTTEAPEAPAISVAPDEVAISAAAATAIVDKATADGRDVALLRIGIKGGGCSGLTYHFGLEDESKATDRVFETTTDGGVVVQVCIDPKSLKFIGGTLLDWSEGLGRSNFEMKNPHVKSSCSCGDSFTIA